MFDALLLLASAAAPQGADPLAPAREGKAQCLAPDREKKVCGALSTYTFLPEGAYRAETEMLLAPSPLITMKVRTGGTVKDGKICETIRGEDFQAGIVTMDGAVMDEAGANGVRTQMAAALTPYLGKAACSVVKPEGDLLLNEVSIDGTVRPELSQRFIWVKPDEGYKVGQ